MREQKEWKEQWEDQRNERTIGGSKGTIMGGQKGMNEQ